jgi:serine O-acetyltransferase
MYYCAKKEAIMGHSLVKNSPLLIVNEDAEISIWAKMRNEAQAAALEEPSLASLLHATILNHRNLSDALAYQLAQKLGGSDMNALQLREICAQVYSANPQIVSHAESDMQSVMERDPACVSFLQPFLYFKGFQALQTHRVAHYLWQNGRILLALHLQSRVSELFQVDIHPAAKIGKGVFIDHATGIVIGETAVVGDNVSMLHNVTLGGTGKEGGDRHPKIGNGVLIGAGAKVLGNILIGENARIAAGSLVLKPVNMGCTVAGIPAKVVGCKRTDCCAENMDQVFDADIATFDPGL